MNPFAEIEVTPLYSNDGMRSQGRSVRIADLDEGKGWSEVGVVSYNYLLVHNARVKDVLDEIAEKSQISDWEQRKLFFDGRRFIYAITSDSIMAEVSVGDLIRFGLIAYNSYDGSRALSVGAYAEHLVCSNGMTSEMFFARFVFRHHRGNVNWDEQTEGAFRSVMAGSRGQLTRFAGMLRTLQHKTMSLEDLTTIRRDHLKILSPSNWGRVVDQYLLQEKHTGFGLLDACTRIFWHSEKQTYSDYLNNAATTDALVGYAAKLTGGSTQ